MDHPVQHMELSCLKYTCEEAVMQINKTVVTLQTNAKQTSAQQQQRRVIFSGGGEVELGPHITQCGLGRGLPLYPVASGSIQLYGHNRHGLKIVGDCAPLGGLVPI